MLQVHILTFNHVNLIQSDPRCNEDLT